MKIAFCFCEILTVRCHETIRWSYGLARHGYSIKMRVWTLPCAGFLTQHWQVMAKSQLISITVTPGVRHGTSNHQQLDCLLNSWFRQMNKKIPKLRITTVDRSHVIITSLLRQTATLQRRFDVIMALLLYHACATTLHCNATSHWLGTYANWSLLLTRIIIIVDEYFRRRRNIICGRSGSVFVCWSLKLYILDLFVYCLAWSHRSHRSECHAILRLSHLFLPC